MSLRHVAKGLAQLSYTDMVLLSKHVGITVDAEDLAQKLSGLNDTLVPDVQPELARTNDAIRKLFKRKRAVNILTTAGGFAIDIPSLSLSFQAPDLPSALNEMVDKLAVYEALFGKLRGG